MHQNEFHPLELAMPISFLIIVYFSVYSSFNPVFRSNENPQYTYERVALLKKRGNYLQALVHIQELTKKFPTNHIYWFQQADLLHRLNQFREEAQALEKAMTYSAVPGEACPAIAEAYEKSKEKEKALSSYYKCLNTEPSNSDFIFYVGHAEERLGSVEKAVEHYEKCLKLIPDHMDCNTGLARISLKKEDPISALRIFETENIKNKIENNSDALLIRGIAYHQIGKLNLARQDLINATNLSPNYFDLWLELGKIESKLGNKYDSNKALEKALKIDPQNSEAMDLIKEMEIK